MHSRAKRPSEAQCCRVGGTLVHCRPRWRSLASANAERVKRLQNGSDIRGVAMDGIEGELAASKAPLDRPA